VRFNLSHSDGRAIYAVTLGREVGIDIERVRPLDDHQSIANRFFSSRERVAIRALPETERVQAFFSCWTRKEAYVKAVGDGLHAPLDRFHVSVGPGEPAKLLEIEDDPGGASRWWMHALEPEPGYVGAVVVESLGQQPGIRVWSLDRAGNAQST
jgi:4'-phosphopantetheinyl transferase